MEKGVRFTYAPHEVGYHLQNLIGATQLQPQGETRNQVSVRVELQADRPVPGSRVTCGPILKLHID